MYAHWHCVQEKRNFMYVTSKLVLISTGISVTNVFTRTPSKDNHQTSHTHTKFTEHGTYYVHTYMHQKIPNQPGTKQVIRSGIVPEPLDAIPSSPQITSFCNLADVTTHTACYLHVLSSCVVWGFNRYRVKELPLCMTWRWNNLVVGIDKNIIIDDVDDVCILLSSVHVDI